MATRYLNPGQVVSLLQASRSAVAKRAGALVELPPEELVPVSSGALDLATYEIRLARSDDGQGPRTERLSEFVEELRRSSPADESFALSGGGTTFIVLLRDGQVAAVTSVEAR